MSKKKIGLCFTGGSKDEAFQKLEDWVLFVFLKNSRQVRIIKQEDGDVGTEELNVKKKCGRVSWLFLTKTSQNFKAVVTFNLLAGWQQNCRLRPLLYGWSHFSSNIHVCLSFTSSTWKIGSVKGLHGVLQLCALRAWQNTSSRLKVLLFSVALDTHLLSGPDLISLRLRHGPSLAFGAQRFYFIFFFPVIPGPRHSCWELS